MPFILKKSLQKIIKNYNSFAKLRNDLHQYTDTTKQASKKAIFYLIKNKLADAQKNLEEAKVNLQGARKIIHKNNFLQESNSYKSAIEEYLEAKLVESYLVGKTTLDLFEFSMPSEIILGAISDFTGELVRKAILLATEKKHQEITDIKDLVEEIVLLLTDIEMGSGGYLRTKIDQVDKNLRKIEEILYSLSK